MQTQEQTEIVERTYHDEWGLTIAEHSPNGNANAIYELDLATRILHITPPSGWFAYRQSKNAVKLTELATA